MVYLRLPSGHGTPLEASRRMTGGWDILAGKPESAKVCFTLAKSGAKGVPAGGFVAGVLAGRVCLAARCQAVREIR